MVIPYPSSAPTVCTILQWSVLRHRRPAVFPKKSFIANLKSLSRHYTVISLADAVEMLKGVRPWRSRMAVLTFDDSLDCTARIAAPYSAADEHACDGVPFHRNH